MPSQNSPTPAELSLAGQIRAHLSWAKTPNRSARTANGRAAFEQRFLDAAGGDPVRAASLRRAYYLDLSRKSAKARRERSAARKAGDE
jgi:hypothetical protein